MPSQLVALATQARKAAGLEALELDDLDEELPDPDPHMPMSACLQLPLPFELVNEFDVAKQVPHLAMMLFTAFSHIADCDEIDDGQPVTNRRDSTKPTKARFMRHPTKKISTEYSLSGGRKVSRQKRSSGDSRRDEPDLGRITWVLRPIGPHFGRWRRHRGCRCRTAW